MPLTISDLEVGAQLGEGSYGTVYKCTQIATGKEFALKVFVTAQVLHHKNRYGKQEVMTEKKALIALEGHPSFVSLHFTFRTRTISTSSSSLLEAARCLMKSSDSAPAT